MLYSQLRVNSYRCVCVCVCCTFVCARRGNDCGINKTENCCQNQAKNQCSLSPVEIVKENLSLPEKQQKILRTLNL